MFSIKYANILIRIKLKVGSSKYEVINSSSCTSLSHGHSRLPDLLQIAI